MIVVVTGGRDFNSPEMVHNAMHHLYQRYQIDMVYDGAASGLDTLVSEWCTEWMVPNTRFPAAWDDLTVPGAVIRTNAVAGHQRNQAMLDANPRPDYGIVFPGGRGTADMHQRMLKAGLTVWVPYG